MMDQYDHTQHVQQMLRTLDAILREPYLYMIKHRLKVTLNDYLVLDVSREEPLKDTLDQLWRQERKMLLKPLKVKLGQQEGEVGLDHGGVTYEFFRIVLSEAFAAEYGEFFPLYIRHRSLTSVGMFTDHAVHCRDRGARRTVVSPLGCPTKRNVAVHGLLQKAVSQ